MRRISTVVAVAVAGTIIGFQPVGAGLLGMPMGLQSVVQHIKFERPTLAPMAYTEFCIRYQGQCRQKTVFRGGPVDLTAERWADLREINRSVNQDIVPERND
jgi:predicted transglutaminase-like cysteine proteinase